MTNRTTHSIVEDIQHRLSQVVPNSSMQTNLEESMRYSLEAGGKRIRPLLLLATLNMIDDKAYDKGMQTAIALEMIHTYSLIHDDLPAMDNDDYRRGKLTNHKVYGEWTAILSGDALLTKAFELIACDQALNAETKVQLIQMLTQASGHLGMVGGQTLDMSSENKAISIHTLEQIHKHKTGALLEFAIDAGGCIAQAPEHVQRTLHEIGHHLGLIFQIKDDLLDVYGDAALLGKPVGSDVQNQKSTYVRLLGQQGAESLLHEHYTQASSHLAELSTYYDTTLLNEIVQMFYKRNH